MEQDHSKEEYEGALADIGYGNPVPNEAENKELNRKMCMLWGHEAEPVMRGRTMMIVCARCTSRVG